MIGNEREDIIDDRDSLRGTYTIDEIEDALNRVGIPYNWIDYTEIPTSDCMTYYLFDQNDIRVPVMCFDAIYAGESPKGERFWIYFHDLARLMTGIIIEYQKCMRRKEI